MKASLVENYELPLETHSVAQYEIKYILFENKEKEFPQYNESDDWQ